jgi:hypothetical protein
MRLFASTLPPEALYADPRPAWREHVLLDHDVKGAEDDPEHGAHQPQHLERVPLVKRGAEDLPPAHGALQPSACSPASQ